MRTRGPAALVSATLAVTTMSGCAASPTFADARELYEVISAHVTCAPEGTQDVEEFAAGELAPSAPSLNRLTGECYGPEEGLAYDVVPYVATDADDGEQLVAALRAQYSRFDMVVGSAWVVVVWDAPDDDIEAITRTIADEIGGERVPPGQSDPPN
ncbi:hypothetical protein NLU66_12225 [Brachybacterium sp. NBEC-018]|uniref:hypothetical protein n=1 Tax=Brachybacterium sp. NBEC-018 TaxID=2996004 RepID=UPI0021753C29|nr:hypothetical protein [Brachybacterium sp. NBEC-018]UVY82989.1 hypothetical protein NLU66_12225 [Brachybacterium sp. NBEC-018]